MNKVYIGNLPYSVNEEELQSLLAQYGNVKSLNVIKDKFTGDSKGFAFAEFDSKEEMDEAISGLDGKDFGGRALRVNVAQDKKREGGSGGGGRRGGGFGGGDRGGRGGDRGKRW